jgi:hypothetical protein
VVSSGPPFWKFHIHSLKAERMTSMHKEIFDVALRSDESDIAELAAELGVEVELLESRLEMASVALLTCCSFNGSKCQVTP